MQKLRLKVAAGFTLIELLVVIAIIGVLAAVTVPAVSSARDRGQSAATAGEVASYQEASAMFLAQNGAYPVPDAADIPGSCLEYDGTSGAPSNPRFCCVADQPCTYAGRTLAPLSRGAFAPSGLGSRAGLLGGAIARLPRLPARPIAAASLQYQGVFHSCNDAACQRPTVAWTQPTACPSGMTRNGVSGFCEASIDRSVVTVIGQRETYCYDGNDDDGDGHADCGDSDCAARAKCGAEDTQERCSDDFDNDADGDSDCNDSGCALAEGCDDVPLEVSCDNHGDDDYDGLVDCADPDCDGEVGGQTNPGGNGSPVDAYCHFASEATDCQDFFDNDGLEDGVDCGDDDCQAFSLCAGGEGGTPSHCVDGYDNDGDMDVDCDDVDCVSAAPCLPNCVPSSPNESNCDDYTLTDEDCDGDVNCSDSDCFYLYTCGGNEIGLCTDGLDNDMDGSYDCNGETDCNGIPECQ